MIVLGLDTATPATAAALRLADGSTAELRDDPAVGAHPGHATRLLGMADRLLADAGLPWGAIDRIAVGVGPGTFTGLRVGIASARGLAQSLQAELIGVSSLLALAAAALAEPGRDDGGPRAALAVIDARRGEVFAAAYADTADAADAAEPATGPGGGRRRPSRLDELLAPTALAPDALVSLASAHERADAPTRGWIAVGDGALRYAPLITSAGLASPPPDSPLHRVSAATICLLGAQGEPAATTAELLPDYRRRPDAELALERAATAGVSG